MLKPLQTLSLVRFSCISLDLMRIFAVKSILFAFYLYWYFFTFASPRLTVIFQFCILGSPLLRISITLVHRPNVLPCISPTVPTVQPSFPPRPNVSVHLHFIVPTLPYTCSSPSHRSNSYVSPRPIVPTHMHRLVPSSRLICIDRPNVPPFIYRIVPTFRLSFYASSHRPNLLAFSRPNVPLYLLALFVHNPSFQCIYRTFPSNFPRSIPLPCENPPSLVLEKIPAHPCVPDRLRFREQTWRTRWVARVNPRARTGRVFWLFVDSVGLE